MRRLFYILLLALLSACSNPFASPGVPGVRLVNATGVDLLYLGMERERAHVVDPAPLWRVADHSERRVRAGETRRAEIEGYERGADVRLFLYAVRDGSGEAPLGAMRTVTHEELRRSGYRIVIDHLPLASGHASPGLLPRSER